MKLSEAMREDINAALKSQHPDLEKTVMFQGKLWTLWSVIRHLRIQMVVSDYAVVGWVERWGY